MSLPQCQELLLDLRDSVLFITLNRPHKRNAMNIALVQELMAVLDAIASQREVRAVVLRGAEGNFCAGGDIAGMSKTGLDQSALERATWESNRIFGRMLTRANRAPQLMVTLLEGAVLGGGFGLACISDIAIADRNAQFALPETSLGIIPAQIAPFVVARIGLTQARRLALLGERIDGLAAQKLGIVHFVSEDAGQMQSRLDTVLMQLKRCAPSANAVTKQLLHDVGEIGLEQLLDRAADNFCAALRGPEGQEGSSAFLQKRRPAWAK